MKPHPNLVLLQQTPVSNTSTWHVPTQQSSLLPAPDSSEGLLVFRKNKDNNEGWILSTQIKRKHFK